MALNMFSMSRQTSARELVWGVSMKVSSCACVEWQMKSRPPEIAMPSWPCGSKVSAIVVPSCVMREAAVIRRRAVPMPMGRNLFRF